VEGGRRGGAAAAVVVVLPLLLLLLVAVRAVGCRGELRATSRAAERLQVAAKIFDAKKNVGRRQAGGRYRGRPGAAARSAPRLA